MSAPRYMVYVSCLKGARIEAFAFAAGNGPLAHVQTIELSGKGLPLAPSPDGRHLYASVIGERDGAEEDRIDAFEIDRMTGALVPLSSTVIVARMAHIRVDRTGGFLLGASFPSSLIAVYPIGDRGHVAAEPSFVMPTPSKAHQILTDPSNRFAFVPNLGADLVMQLVFDDNTGAFHENAPPALQFQPGAGCRHVAYHPNRRYVYLLNELDGSLIVLRFDPATGKLSEIARDTILRPDLDGSPWGAQVHVSPDGRRLFASERRGASLAVWDIVGASGQISNRRIVETGANPRCFDISPDGRHLVLGAMGEDRIDVYDITGEVPEKIAGYPTGPEPGWVEIVRL